MPQRRTRYAALAPWFVFAVVVSAPMSRAWADAGDQGAWTTTIPVQTVPTPHLEHSAAYDPLQQRMLMFGGWGSNETWSLALSDPITWSPVNPSGTLPPVVRGALAIFDASRSRLVIYNGENLGGDGNVWALTTSPSTFWTPLPSLHPGRLLPSIVYDSTHDRLIVFGGLGVHDVALNDVWALDFPTNTWTQLQPSGPTPPARWGHAAVYDPVGDRMIIFSGRDLTNDVWQLSLSGPPTWSQLAPAGVPPTARGHSAYTFDPQRRRMLIHGGYEISTGNRLNDTWALNLNGSPAWEALIGSGTPPPQNSHSTAVYDELNARMIIYGGFNAPPNPGQVWELTFEPVGPRYLLNTSVSGSGAIVRNPDRASYVSGTKVSLQANAPIGWHFVEWTGDVQATDNPVSVTMDTDKSVTAVFEQDHYHLSQATVGQGTITLVPDQPDFVYGDVVTVSAHAAPGWSFTGWSGDATGSDSTTTVLMHGDRSVVASFADLTPPTATVVYPNGGEILAVGSDYKFAWQAADDAGIVGVDLAISRDGGATYETILTSAPNTGSLVWTVTGPGANTTKTPVYAGRFRVTAIDIGGHHVSDESDAAFAIYDLVPFHTVTVTTVGQGTIERSPDQDRYQEGSTVTLTAHPSAGWEFVGWSGDVDGTTNPVERSIDQNLSVSARFRDASPPTVSIVYPNGGEVLIVGSPYKLAWNAADDQGVASVDLDLSRDNGVTWESIATGLPNSGTYVWEASRPGTSSGPAPIYTALVRATARDSGGNAANAQSASGFAVHELAPTAVGSAPVTFALRAEPNPARSATTITYALPTSAHVRLSVLDLAGREVAVLVNESKAAGVYRAPWTARAGNSNAAGVYFVRYRAGRHTMIQRLAMMH